METVKGKKGDDESMPLFASPKVISKNLDPGPYPENHKQKTEIWLREHGPMADLLYAWAKELASHNRRFGIALLIERLRWEGTIQGWKPASYKINNSHRAYIARWLIGRDPSLEKFMTFREVKF